MDQFVLVSASAYNNILNTQSDTRQEPPKYLALEIPPYQIRSLKREINKNLFAKADSSVDRVLSCPRIRVSKSHFTLDVVETVILLSDFAQQLRRKSADVLDIFYLTLLE